MPRLINSDLLQGVYLWKIEESAAQLYSLVKLTKAEMQRFEAIKSPFRLCEKLATRALLQSVCGADTEIEYLPSGAPVVRGLSISISHTSNFVALYIKEAGRNVGIDIESVERCAKKLLGRVVSEAEIVMVSKVFDKNPSILLWCVKEAMYKALGVEGVDFIKELNILEVGQNLGIKGLARGLELDVRAFEVEGLMVVCAEKL